MVLPQNYPPTLDNVLGWDLNSKNYIFNADVDECASEDAHNCDVNANCTNIPGSFLCMCNAEFTGDGTLCIGKPITSMM